MNPIATIIHDLVNSSRFLTWTGETNTWIEAGGTVEVPFDVWSVSDKNQREALKTDVKSGRVSLELRVMKPNGCQEIIPYSPVGALCAMPVVKPVAAEPKVEVQQKNYTVLGNHVVVANNPAMDKLAGQFGMKTQIVEQPKESDVEDDLKDAVAFSNNLLNEQPEDLQKEASEEEPVKMEDIVFPAEEVQQEAERIQEMLDGDPKDVEDEAAEEGLTYEEFETKIDELLSAKNYEEAHKLLVDRYGEDKITFKASALRYTKTFEAVVKKYKLDE